MNAKEMMSESLVDKFETDDFSHFEKILLCNIDCIVLEKIETIVGIVEGFEPFGDNRVTIRVKIPIDDAFSISEAWKDIVIKDYKLSFRGQIQCYEGIFKIHRFKILNVDSDKSICSVSFKLVKE